MSREKTKTITSIGGQALIEGIMMRGPQKTEVAVRLPDGSVSTQAIESRDLRGRSAVWRLPLLRGIAGFVDSLTLGYRALSLSARKAGLDEEEEESKFDRWIRQKFGRRAMDAVVTAGTVLGVALGVGLFFLLPTWLFNLLQGAAGPGVAGWRAPLEGLMRFALFLGYLALCASLPDMKRVFEYHGAEHKTIFCYENNEALTVENVKRHQRFHPRCGTSFLVLMLLIGICIGFFIPFSNPFLRTAVKILCIPLAVGIGYELIRYCGRNDNALTRVISAPGLWMQRLTTREPDDGMMEVAIAALRAVIPENGEDRIELEGGEK
ncbi:MAG TPA: DUF1385 domain-containing protein [Ruminococcaceae bacterium]|jgi:uncharacterized protein YqhQ|nr:DUF1385 domain-containing protein [Oscillospiraceae bacterium]HBQ45548.1 DUF1385 domain-containing protein [Oscillospiraceae bacterium]